MFTCNCDNKEGHQPANSAEPAIFQYVKVKTDFAPFFSREGEGKFSSTLVLADMACLAGTAKVSNFIIITSGKQAAPVLVYYHLSVLKNFAQSNNDGMVWTGTGMNSI